ncbi:hypothetical protein LVO79_18770 (plasmid) [Roseivivax marinus]|uniref:hypothetical protein n=1 Tax=Roseivivax marinus TaxID=1379903 RepID=UPI001F039DC7|nr:hypothetical protein [Roseivivax marinus]UMA67060.1 hypothetical protein LVO79_18770 [Roseivivax marinus]
MKTSVLLAAAFALATGPSFAAVCDYKPSILMSKAGSAVSNVPGSQTAAIAGRHVVGEYVMTPTGIATLGSSAGGVLSGAGGVFATIGSVVMAPVTLIAGAVTFGAAGSYEGLCYFKVERVTDEDEVRKILTQVAGNDPSLSIGPTEKGGDALFIAGPPDKGGATSYQLSKLYIADGRLKHRDRFLNTDLGEVTLVMPEPEPSEQVDGGAGE